MSEWHVFKCDQHTHVIPDSDLREHFLATECWCRPTPEAEHPWVVVHHSKDGREVKERMQ